MRVNREVQLHRARELSCDLLPRLAVSGGSVRRALLLCASPHLMVVQHPQTTRAKSQSTREPELQSCSSTFSAASGAVLLTKYPKRAIRRIAHQTDHVILIFNKNCAPYFISCHLYFMPNAPLPHYSLHMSLCPRSRSLVAFFIDSGARSCLSHRAGIESQL